MISGWGGAGAYSDGKLNITGEIGGFLNEIWENDVLEALFQKYLSTFTTTVLQKILIMWLRGLR